MSEKELAESIGKLSDRLMDRMENAERLQAEVDWLKVACDERNEAVADLVRQRDALRSALAEALEHWQGDATLLTDGIRWEAERHIAELRAKHLGGGE